MRSTDFAFKLLSESEKRKVLAEEGRLRFKEEYGVDIEPVSYPYHSRSDEIGRKIDAYFGRVQ